MDELTQQNAALVEQATCASQAMAHEAHALHEMMGSYRLGDLVRQAPPAATVAAPQADSRTKEPAPRGERRGSARPRSRASGSAQVATAVVDNDNDSEWQEF
jgi:methyl-accepting chemotaxis protein